jgi:hypothetical protein
MRVNLYEPRSEGSFMKTRQLCFLTWFAFSCASTHVGRAQGQSVPILFDGERSGCKAVLNAPYVAEKTTSDLREGGWWEVIRRVSVARDSQGRTMRRERSASMSVNGSDSGIRYSRIISDPAAGTITRWIEEEATVTVSHHYPVCFSFPAEAKTTLSGTGPGAVVFVDYDWQLARMRASGPWVSRFHNEFLGDRYVQGLRAEGLRRTDTLTGYVDGKEVDSFATGEQWYSPGLQIRMIEAQTERPRETRLVEVKKLRLEEPAPALFKLPGGAHIVDADKH